MNAGTDFRFDAIETPEGRAIFPFGSWGSGYLADAATERRLGTYLRRQVFVVVGFLTLQSVVRTFIVPVPEPAALLVMLVAIGLFHYAAIKLILRKAARSPVRVTSDELLRLRVARGGRTAMVAAHWCGLVACAAVAIGVGIVTEGWERWLVEAACVPMLVVLAVSLRRLHRIPD